MIRFPKNLDPSRATHSSLVVPCPSGLQYDPYQIAGIEYAAQRRDTLIGDEPGLGKTIQAIGLANFLKCQRILVICPSFLKPNWLKEFEKWKILPLEIDFVKDGKPVEFGHVVIINYELLEKHGEHIREIEWDLLIADEVHRLKNKRADRTRQVLGGIKRDSQKRIIARNSAIEAKHRIFLTGTPVLNGKPKELWPLLQSVDPTGLGSNWFEFAKRYCQLFEIKRFNPAKGKEEHVGWKWDGADNLEELQERMRLRFMVRRLKSEVMTQLPAKRRVVMPLEVGDRKLRKLLQTELQEFEEYAKGKAEDVYLEMPPFGDFAKRMQEIGLLMVPMTIEVIENELESLPKLVVMCWHNEVARQIAEPFGDNCLLINEDVDPVDRFPLVEQFQTDTKIKLLVGTIGSASEGLTMTASRVMIFPERAWTPGQVTQAEDRIHRRGQNEQCLFKHLVLEGSLSERQVRILLTKQNNNDRILDRS